MAGSVHAVRYCALPREWRKLTVTPGPGGVWTEILFDDIALSALCAAFLVPLVRGWQRRARVAERAMDIASDGFVVAAADGRLLRVNDGYCAMTGLTRDVLIRARLHDLPVDTALPPLDEHLALVKQRGMARIDTQHQRAQGDALDVQVKTACLPDLRCFAGFIRDDSRPAPRQQPGGGPIPRSVVFGRSTPTRTPTACSASSTPRHVDADRKLSHFRGLCGSDLNRRRQPGRQRP
jgi:PAS domain S-box-containing protein